MKTLEVLDKVLKGKRLTPGSQRLLRETLQSVAKCSEDWPASGVVINEWLASLTNYADTTVKTRFRYGHLAGSYIQKAGGKNKLGGYNFPNPFDEAEVPRVSKKKRRYFTPDEMMKIIEVCYIGYDWELILTLIDSTCRIGELVGLKGGDIGEGVIKVKGKTGERIYRLDMRICEALKKLAGDDDDYVFKSREGKQVTVNALKLRVRYIINKAGITGSKVGPHTLRHSGASLVAKETLSALAVKALLQHDDITTSMEYIHDAEVVIQQRISPLQIIREQANNGKGLIEPRQIGLREGNGTSTALALTEGKVVDGEVVDGEVVEDEPDALEMFPEINEGVETRPLLKTVDMRLMRKAFLLLTRDETYHLEMLQARELMKRILRRSK